MTKKTDFKRRQFLALSAAAGGVAALPAIALGKKEEASSSERIVSLKEAHKGTIEIDVRIMNQYETQPQETQDFYLDCRTALTGKNPKADVAAACKKFNREKLGGPMLGNITSTSVAVWMHLPTPTNIRVVVTEKESTVAKTFSLPQPSSISSTPCDGLSPDTAYAYQVFGDGDSVLGEGGFMTPPTELSDQEWKIAFGADFHKVGMYRPELMKLIRERGNRAMLLIGDSAVDGRKDDYGMIDTDYMLRNLSAPVQQLTANVPVFATWDDHDYWGNDISGKWTRGKKPIDVDGLRKKWKTQWNNPDRDKDRKGIYFQTHIGPIHYIALDTRSCRVHQRKNEKGCFLGDEQTAWLKQQIKDSTSPFIIISSGTMWTDYISDGKDSWGVWDTQGREEIFTMLDEKKDSRAILISGDRHGARGFAIPRGDNRKIIELEVGTLGGVPGPKPFGDNKDDQLFGLASESWALGELTFSNNQGKPQAVFRLINQEGEVLETVTIDG